MVVIDRFHCSSPIQQFFEEHTCRLLHCPRSIWYMFRYINSVTSLYFRYRPIWGMCPRGLLKYAYLLNSLPSCLLLIPCSLPCCQIAKFLGSTSIRHRSHASTPDRCLIDVDFEAFSIWGAVLTRPEWCSPAAGYLHVRCPKWWRPHEVISFSDHYSDVIMGVMVSQSTVVSIVYSTVCSGEIPSLSPVTWSFDVFFELRLNKRLSKQS